MTESVVVLFELGCNNCFTAMGFSSLGICDSFVVLCCSTFLLGLVCGSGSVFLVLKILGGRLCSELSRFVSI